jgi:hypothetical protein
MDGTRSAPRSPPPTAWRSKAHFHRAEGVLVAAHLHQFVISTAALLLPQGFCVPIAVSDFSAVLQDF